MHTKTLPILIAFVLCCCHISSVKSQQDPQYSMYMFNQMAINPAYAGSLEQASAMGLFRRQWMNFPGAPQTGTFTIHSPLRNKNVGLGFQFINDQHGIIKSNTINAAYAYHLKLKSSRLSMGLQAGADNFSAGLANVILSQNNEFDAAFANNINQWDFNAGAGLFWYSDKFFVGASVPHLRNNILSAKELNNLFVARRRTHAFLTGGYVFTLSPVWKLKPSLMVKYASGAPLQADFNMNVYFLDVVGLGVSYRTQDALVGMIEILISDQIRFGYSYDQRLARLMGQIGPSHEFMVRYDFGFNKSKTLSPRLF